MKIEKNGIVLDTKAEIIEKVEEKMKAKFGKDFYIKPESVLGNIAVANALMIYDIQKQILELSKQFDPDTATGKYQDALYQRLGLTRIQSKKTTLKREVIGEANLTCAANTIYIQCNNEEYTNPEGFTLDENGSALVEFACVISGETEVNAGDVFEIISSPDGIQDTLEPSDMQISIGRDTENDREFRTRFYLAKAKTTAKGTRNANIANLLPYVDNKSFLRIISKASDKTFPTGKIMIIAHHNTTDEIFAKAIFDTVAFGIGFVGNTTVTVFDKFNHAHEVLFQKASPIPIFIKSKIVISQVIYGNSILANIKNNLIEYINNIVYGLGAEIYALRLSTPILDTDGVISVENIVVKRESDATYSDSVILNNDEVPYFSSDNIVLDYE